MGIGRRIQRFLQSLLAPAVFLSLVGYFCWNATQGDRGLQAYAYGQAQLARAQAELAKAVQERDTLERRVAGMRPSRLDPDTLDEQARLILNMSDPADIIVPYGPGRQLSSRAQPVN